MKTFDFTQLGGFPLTQDVLKDMQEAYTEIAKSLTDSTEPVLLAGFNPTTTGTTVSYSEGLIGVSGEVIKIPPGSHQVSNSATAQIKIIPLSSVLVYDDGSSHASKINKTGAIVEDGSGSITISTLKTLLELRASQLRTDWIVFKNDQDSYVEYQIDRLNNRCHCRGWTRSFSTYNGLGQPEAKSIATGMPVAASYRTFFDTTLDVHTKDVVLTAAGGELRGGKGRIIAASLSIFPQTLQGSWTDAQLRNLRQYFNFSYPI